MVGEFYPQGATQSNHVGTVVSWTPGGLWLEMVDTSTHQAEIIFVSNPTPYPSGPVYTNGPDSTTTNYDLMPMPQHQPSLEQSFFQPSHQHFIPDPQSTNLVNRKHQGQLQQMWLLQQQHQIGLTQQQQVFAHQPSSLHLQPLSQPLNMTNYGQQQPIQPE
ncbi:hypothetical protein BGZ65_006375, partial [Modicella reniformis]